MEKESKRRIIERQENIEKIVFWIVIIIAVIALIIFWCSLIMNTGPPIETGVFRLYGVWGI